MKKRLFKKTKIMLRKTHNFKTKKKNKTTKTKILKTLTLDFIKAEASLVMTTTPN